ncbi:MAG: hypothetical protein GYB24_00850 [Rhodobacteraceae bacterium]|nr:hypothetical protein [Paracoccaceae bacterium]
MPLPITSLYAAILALMLIVLTYYVILGRARSGISILHGEDMALATRIRQHGNFIEFVPMALIVMALAEFGGANSMALHIAGVLLVVARIAQPFGMHPEIATKPLRIIGGAGTHLSILISVALILTARFAG